MSSNQKTSAPGGGLQNKLKNMTDTNLLLMITVVIFFVMYIGAILFLGGGFRRPQMFLSLLNENAFLIVLSCGLSLVMITRSIDISVGGITGLVTMCCAVYLDQHNGNVFVSLLLALAIGLAFGIFDCVSGNPAFYRHACRYVLCPRYDDDCQYESFQCAE